VNDERHEEKHTHVYVIITSLPYRARDKKKRVYLSSRPNRSREVLRVENQKQRRRAKQGKRAARESASFRMRI
jgi:hypothetical protein